MSPGDLPCTNLLLLPWRSDFSKGWPLIFRALEDTFWLLELCHHFALPCINLIKAY
jgi:hypothetical protein